MKVVVFHIDITLCKNDLKPVEGEEKGLKYLLAPSTNMVKGSRRWAFCNKRKNKKQKNERLKKNHITSKLFTRCIVISTIVTNKIHSNCGTDRQPTIIATTNNDNNKQILRMKCAKKCANIMCLN